METNNQPNSPKMPNWVTPKFCGQSLVLWSIIGGLLLVVVVASVAWYQIIKHTPQISSEQQTANLQTYTGNQISFQYPKAWRVTDNGPTENLTSGFDLTVVNSSGPAHPDTSTDTLSELHLSTVTGSAGDSKNRNSNTFTYQSGGTGYDYIKFISGSTTLYAACGYDSQATVDICNQILSTFKFTDSNAVDTPTSQTYTNTKYEFSFSYPSNFVSKPASQQPVGGSLMQLTELASLKDSTNGGSISVQETNGILNPKNIKYIYGTADSSKVNTVSIGSQVGYKFTEGDAGCSGPIIETQLNASTILVIDFINCEGDKTTIDDQTITQILSTFKFTNTSVNPPAVKPSATPPASSNSGTSTYVNKTGKYSIDIPAGFEATEVPYENGAGFNLDINAKSNINDSNGEPLEDHNPLIDINTDVFNTPLTADEERNLIACGGDKVSFDSVMFLGSIGASVCTKDSQGNPWFQRSLFILTPDRKTLYTIITPSSTPPSDQSVVDATDKILVTFKLTN